MLAKPPVPVSLKLFKVFFNGFIYLFMLTSSSYTDNLGPGTINIYLFYSYAVL